MIAHYSAPLSAERGAVAQCFAGVDPGGAAERRPERRFRMREGVRGRTGRRVQAPGGAELNLAAGLKSVGAALELGMIEGRSRRA